jgi:hypothetical protein
LRVARIDTLKEGRGGTLASRKLKGRYTERVKESYTERGEVKLRVRRGHTC